MEKTGMHENEWQNKEIWSAVHAAELPDSKFLVHELVAIWLESWGMKDEIEPPTHG